MLLAIIIVAYIIGYALSYLYLRAVVRSKHNRNWLLIEKLNVMTLSLFSWVIVCMCAMLLILGPLIKIDFDKEVKW